MQQPRSWFVLFSLVVLTVHALTARALPIGFGYNQGDLKFQELKDDDFIVYFDQRTPHDGKVALHSLHTAKPHLERWFQVKRSSPQIVNMSAESDNASFANFMTDSIELQTLGQGSRDLAWHEYTHAMMYQHLDNIFGPAGALLHLPWMEAWFLEGLAEAMSVSVGSEQQAGIERFQALNDDWPTWDRIHSLYTSGPFSYRGYATSGAFVAWMMRTYHPEKLAAALQTFRSDTMPWWWPWALTPFNKFWPMDTMLRSWTGFSGKELYEQYKTAATKHWKNLSKAPQLVPLKSDATRFASTSSLQSIQGQPAVLTRDNGKAQVTSLEIDPATKQAKHLPKSRWTVAPDEDVYANSVTRDHDTVAYTAEHWPQTRQRRAAVVIQSGHKKTVLKRDALWIQQVWIAEQKVWWLETQTEFTRLCYTSRTKPNSKDVTCPVTSTTPQSLNALGQQTQSASSEVSTIWLSRTTQTARGDRFEVLVVHSKDDSVHNFAWTHGGQPHSVAFTPSGTWLLLSDRSRRYLRKFDGQGHCGSSFAISDMPIKIMSSNDSTPWVVLWLGEEVAISQPRASGDDWTSCTTLSTHMSPLLAATTSSTPLSFAQAMQTASTWDVPEVKPTENAMPLSSDPSLASAMDLASSTDGSTASTAPEAKPSEWRGRPIFAFPWIGADDALGPQLGIVSVPLMDHMQNETVRATALIGLYSRFPYQELSLIENRWTPTWVFSLYRSQVYNGRYLDKEKDEIYSSFLDEKGGRIDASLAQRWRYVSILWSGGVRGGHLAKYIGEASHVGAYKEVFAAANIEWRFAEKWHFDIGSQNRAAPKSINENFDYYVTGASTSVTRVIGSGSVELGIEGEKTRGPYRRDFQEMYTPLKTFVPGSGGGYNKNSFALTADQGLFSPLFGDTQARAKLNATHPLIENFDKFTGLIYIDRLDFSAFLNHGTAWRGDSIPKNSSFVTAHGYNVDLLMDNKGVRFNLGAGFGQVVRSPWQVYATAGFDALF